MYFLRSLTLFLSQPSQNHKSRDLRLLSEVDHPDGTVDVEVVEHRAAGQSVVSLSVHCPRCVTVHPLISNVTLYLTSIVDPRFLPERQILH